MINTAREAAFRALSAFRKGKRPEIEAQKAGPDPRETSFAMRLTSGIMQNMILIDYWLSYFVKGGISALQPEVLDILRLSAYQIAFMDRVPKSAAVSEGVELAKKYTNLGAVKLINAVLRRVAEFSSELPLPQPDDMIKYLSVKYSHPQELVEYFIKAYGVEMTQVILSSDNDIPPIYARVNTPHVRTEQLIQALQEEGCAVKRHELLPYMLEIATTGSVSQLKAFKDGLFTVQDPAAAIVVEAADICPGYKIIDACASPGGKTFAAASALGREGSVLSCDVSEKKLVPITEGARRLGLDLIETKVMDASVPHKKYIGAFDRVLADVPCSGFGVIRKKPEIRYKSLASISVLPKKQLAILKNLSTYVNLGGILLYSTCTLIKEENESVMEAFLNESSGFEPEPFAINGLPYVSDGHITLLPGEYGTDGFFICRLRKKH